VAIGVQLLALQVVLGAGVTFLFDVRAHVIWLAVVACLLATVGLACAGVLYGALSAGLRVRDTLLPLLVLPVLAPVLLAGSKVWQAALDGSASSGTQWLKILVPFAIVYLVVGIVLYGPLQEAA
jgi:heme exporter protein B